MTTFDERDKVFENKFAHDEELSFKATARRNKLLGLWAAEKLGKKGAEAEAYAVEVVDVEFDTNGHDIAQKLLKDFSGANIVLTIADIHREMDYLLPIARKQLMG